METQVLAPHTIVTSIFVASGHKRHLQQLYGIGNAQAAVFVRPVCSSGWVCCPMKPATCRWRHDSPANTSTFCQALVRKQCGMKCEPTRLAFALALLKIAVLAVYCRLGKIHSFRTFAGYVAVFPLLLPKL
eukprot:4038552-Amphidinium_carterae.1